MYSKETSLRNGGEDLGVSPGRAGEAGHINIIEYRNSVMMRHPKATSNLQPLVYTTSLLLNMIMEVDAHKT